MAQAGDLLFIIRMMRIESFCSQSSFTMFPHSCDAPLEHDGSTKLEVIAFSELIRDSYRDVDDAVSVRRADRRRGPEGQAKRPVAV